MPIARRHLADDEEVVVEVRPHWSVVARPILGGILAVSGAIALVVALGPLPTWLTIAIICLVALPALRAGVALGRWWQTVTVLTSHRLLFRSGVLQRSFVQINLDRIVDVHCSQSLLDRLLGRGVITLEVDNAPPVTLDDVRRPRAFQQVVSAELRLQRNTPSTSELASGEGEWEGGEDAGLERKNDRPIRRRSRRGSRHVRPFDDADDEVDLLPEDLPAIVEERLAELLEEFRNDEISAAQYEASRHEVLKRWNLDGGGNR